MPPLETTRAEQPPARKHRRIGYRVQMVRPFHHSEDTDIIDGVYCDSTGLEIGMLIPEDVLGAAPDEFLVLPHETIPLMRVEEALELDNRAAWHEQVVGLIYDAGEAPPAAVVANGDRWDAGDVVVYTFDTDEDALAAQE